MLTAKCSLPRSIQHCVNIIDALKRRGLEDEGSDVRCRLEKFESGTLAADTIETFAAGT